MHYIYISSDEVNRVDMEYVSVCNVQRKSSYFSDAMIAHVPLPWRSDRKKNDKKMINYK